MLRSLGSCNEGSHRIDADNFRQDAGFRFRWISYLYLERHRALPIFQHLSLSHICPSSRETIPTHPQLEERVSHRLQVPLLTSVYLQITARTRLYLHPLHNLHVDRNLPTITPVRHKLLHGYSSNNHNSLSIIRMILAIGSTARNQAITPKLPNNYRVLDEECKYKALFRLSAASTLLHAHQIH